MLGHRICKLRQISFTSYLIERKALLNSFIRWAPFANFHRIQLEKREYVSREELGRGTQRYHKIHLHLQASVGIPSQAF